MTHDWVLNVLNDLKIFAENNSLPMLAENLDRTKLSAALELSQSGALDIETPDCSDVKIGSDEVIRDF